MLYQQYQDWISIATDNDHYIQYEIEYSNRYYKLPIIFNNKNLDMNQKKKALGKGLGALLDAKPLKDDKPSPDLLHVKINVQNLIEWGSNQEFVKRTPAQFTSLKKHLNKIEKASAIKLTKEGMLKWKGVGIKGVNFMYQVITMYCNANFEQEYDTLKSDNELILFDQETKYDEYVITPNYIVNKAYTGELSTLNVDIEVVQSVYGIINQKPNPETIEGLIKQNKRLESKVKDHEVEYKHLMNDYDNLKKSHKNLLEDFQLGKQQYQELKEKTAKPPKSHYDAHLEHQKKINKSLSEQLKIEIERNEEMKHYKENKALKIQVEKLTKRLESKEKTLENLRIQKNNMIEQLKDAGIDTNLKPSTSLIQPPETKQPQIITQQSNEEITIRIKL